MRDKKMRDKKCEIKMRDKKMRDRVLRNCHAISHVISQQKHGRGRRGVRGNVWHTILICNVFFSEINERTNCYKIRRIKER